MPPTLPSSSVRFQGGWAHGAAILGYLLLTLIMTWPLLPQFGAAIPGDGFDGWQNYWNQWWIKIALIDRQSNPLRTDLLFAPTGVSLYFHTLNPFNGVTTLPVQLAAGLIPAYNAAVLLAWTLGGYGTFLLTRDQLTIHNYEFSIVNCYWAAFLAGVIFTFSPFHMAHLLGHMQVMSLQWIPFYALYLLRTLRAVQQGKPWRREALLAAFFLILVGLCDWYFVLYLVFFTGLAVMWAWLTAGAKQSGAQLGLGSPSRVLMLGRLLAVALLIGALFFVALSFWLLPMLRETRQFSFMVRPATDLYILSASVMDFFIPNRLHTLFRPESFSWVGNQIAPVSERTIAIGYTALALAAVGALLRPRRAALWIASALFFFLMALGPVIHLGDITAGEIPDVLDLPLHFTPFGILAYLSDFVRLSRSVSRYAVMVQLSVAVLAGIGAAAIVNRTRMTQIRRIGADSKPTENLRQSARSASSAFYLSTLLLILILFEYWVAPYPMSPPDTPDWYASLAAQPGEGAVLNLPMNYDRPGYLLYQTVHGRPLTAAYISRDDPRTLTERAPVLQHFRHLGPDILDVDPVAAGPTVLNDLGVEYVVLDRYKMPGGAERDVTEALADAIFAENRPVHEDDRITVYRVEPIAAAYPYPVLGPLNWGPLTVAQDGQLTRALVGPAEIAVRHARPGARLRIRYRTQPQTGAVVHSGSATTVLPPAAAGDERFIPLNTDQGAAVTVTLRPDVPGQFLVEEIEVVGE